MTESNKNYKTDPAYISQEEFTYTPNLEETNPNILHLILSISHQDIHGMLKADDLKLILVDSNGDEFKSFGKSKGELTQVGGSLGLTSNLEVDFSLDEKVPSELIIHHNEVSTHFKITVGS